MSSQKVFRHEFKYYINYFEYHTIRNRLRAILKNDDFSNNKGDYHIRSLYFDDIHNSALYEKQAGVLSRRKFRIRIYNLSDETIKLEKKSRIGQFINKESVTISKQQYFKIVSGDILFLKESDITLFNEFYFWHTALKIKPDVIVDYTREAYTSNLSKIRITIDKNLRTGLNSLDIFDKSIPTIDVIEKPLFVLEVKYNAFLPDFLRRAIQISSNQRYAISKFVICKKYTKYNNWEDN